MKLYWLLFVALVAHGKMTLFGVRSRAPEGWTQVQTQEPLDDVVLPFIVALKQQNLEALEDIYWDRTDPGTHKRIPKIQNEPVVVFFECFQFLLTPTQLAELAESSRPLTL